MPPLSMDLRVSPDCQSADAVYPVGEAAEPVRVRRPLSRALLPHGPFAWEIPGRLLLRRRLPVRRCV